MHRLGDVLSSIPKIRESIDKSEGKTTCKRCNTTVEFVKNQYKKNCPTCGMSIKIPQTQVIKESNDIHCYFCMDTGLVNYEAQDGDQMNEFSARCTCPMGMARRESGVPFINEVQNIGEMNYIAGRNKHEYDKRKGNK